MIKKTTIWTIYNSLKNAFLHSKKRFAKAYLLAHKNQ